MVMMDSVVGCDLEILRPRSPEVNPLIEYSLKSKEPRRVRGALLWSAGRSLPLPRFDLA